MIADRTADYFHVNIFGVLQAQRRCVYSLGYLRLFVH